MGLEQIRVFLVLTGDPSYRQKVSLLLRIGFLKFIFDSWVS